MQSVQIFTSCVSNHSFILTPDSLYSFGKNSHGQLALNNTVDQTEPTLVSSIDPSKIISISCGANYTIFLLKNSILSIGQNNKAQLGIGKTFDALVPTDMIFSHSSVEVKSISCGNEHSLILIDSGDLYAFGSNRHGQLGIGDKEPFKSVPTKVKFFEEKKIKIVTALCGARHSCVLSEGGEVYVFGDGEDGQLGDNKRGKMSVYNKSKKRDEVVCRVTEPKVIDFGKEFISAIYCGGRHCLALSEESIFAFGDNQYGQLGINETSSMSTPKILDLLNPNSVNEIACGMSHTLVNTEDGVYVFGLNYFGQLGLGYTENIKLPTRLNLNQKEAMSVYCGSSFSFVKTSDYFFSFGRNENGQLGTKSIVNQTSPHKIKVKLNIQKEQNPLDKISSDTFQYKKDLTYLYSLEAKEAFWKEKDIMVTLKYYSIDSSNNSVFERICNTLSKLTDQNIMKIYGFTFDHETQKTLLVSEHIENILEYELESGISNNLKRQFEIVKSLCNAIIILSKLKIVHGNINPKNIFISEDKTVKIGNIEERYAGINNPNSQIDLWKSPESLIAAHLSSKSDIFSLGVLIIQMNSGKKPKPSEFASLSGSNHYHINDEKARRKDDLNQMQTDKISLLLRSIAEECIQSDVKLRPKPELLLAKLEEQVNQ